MTNNELYEGFPEGKKYRDEAIQSWGDEVKKTEERIKKMGKERWKEVQVEGDAITKKLADLADLSPQSPEVQKAIGLLHRHLENFYPVPEERLRGLGQMYVSDDRFRAHYDKYKEGLAEFINQAIQVYCDRGMKA